MVSCVKFPRRPTACYRHCVDTHSGHDMAYDCGKTVLSSSVLDRGKQWPLSQGAIRHHCVLEPKGMQQQTTSCDTTM